jgi:cytochrome c biogenesis protein CcmG/thiol:disulfide interchange protein DsbE
MKKASWPLWIFGGLVALFVLGLMLNPRHVPSPLVGQMAPALQGTDLLSEQQINSADFNQAWLLNAWASWCSGCYLEHSHLMELTKTQPDLVVVGLNYKDQAGDAKAWLEKHGSPYQHVIFDPTGRIGMDWGLIGTPETFLIDAQGRVVDKWMGALTPERIERSLLPALQKLDAKGGR